MSKEATTKFEAEGKEAWGRTVGATAGWLLKPAADRSLYIAISGKTVPETRARAR